MNLPPVIMRVKINQPDRSINLWLPLFIIVPIILIILVALFFLLLPLLLITALVMWLIGLRWPLQMLIPAIGLIGTLMFALRGLKVDVNSGTERVFIAFS